MSEDRGGLLPLDGGLARATAGGKAATLGALLAQGHRVPAGFVVPVEVCRGVNGALPAPVREALAERLRALGDGPVAVRSSAVCEDGADASFAGQLTTALGVSGADAVASAIVRCVASARARPAQSYLRALGGSADLEMAVLVQRMIEPEASGVAFSVDPTTGDPRVVLEAIRGLGDALVGGEITPERWAVDPDGARLARTTGAPVLDARTAREIAALARRLHDEQGGPQDVEWALAGGELHVLQSRPITAVPLEPALDDPTTGSWMKDRVHYPTPVSAFGASIYNPALSAGISAMASDFGLLVEGFETYWRAGEMYGRPVPPGGKDGPAPPWWLLAILARVLPPLRRRAAAARRMLADGVLEGLARDWDDHGRAELESEIRALAAIDLAPLDLDAKLGHLERVVELLDRGARLHFRLFIPWVVVVSRFATLTRELLGWDDGRALQLLAGRSPTSSAPGRELGVLAARVRALPSGGSGGDPLDGLAARDPALAADLEAWKLRWGLRASAYDPGAPTLAEQPGLLDGLVRDAVAEAHAVPAAERSALLGEALARLGEGEPRARFEQALAQAERIFPLREDNVLYTDNLVCGLARRAVLAVGDTLAERGQLDAPEDVVELKHEEVRLAARDPRFGARALARRRRRERAWVAAHPGPAVLGAPAAPPPDLRGLPRALRTVNEAFLWAMAKEYPEPDARPAGARAGTLAGIGAWPGRYTGIARVVRSEAELASLRQGEILVAAITTPAWSIVFPKLGALVTDHGGTLSHAAIVARELGIPAVLDTGRATAAITTGQRLEVDGTHGTVTILAGEGQP